MRFRPHALGDSNSQTQSNKKRFETRVGGQFGSGFNRSLARIEVARIWFFVFASKVQNCTPVQFDGITGVAASIASFYNAACEFWAIIIPGRGADTKNAIPALLVTF